MEGRAYMELGMLGPPEGLALGCVAVLLVVVVLRPPLPLEILEEAQHHVRQAHLAVHGLLHHHGWGAVFAAIWFLLLWLPN